MQTPIENQKRSPEFSSGGRSRHPLSISLKLWLRISLDDNYGGQL
jgi:hypothetical protein